MTAEDTPSLRLTIATSLSDVPANAWNACARSGDITGRADDPFTSHAFLSALETSGSVGPGSGWMPAHILLHGPDDVLAACAPTYIKSHSYGEYMFDFGLAEAFERAGRAYYPKIQVAVPFTPVTGPRLMVRDDAARPVMTHALASALGALQRHVAASSTHVTFCDARDRQALLQAGFQPRSGEQYHWFNRGYQTFDDFLSTLPSRKRKMIRRERAQVADSGVTFEILTGDAIKPEHWDHFYLFYRDTSARKWGTTYLTRGFFEEIGRTMREDILLILVRDGSTYIAGALNLIGANALFGRYWGTTHDISMLHFETCYYRAIDYALAHGLERVEAGAQGEHKLLRGYECVETCGAYSF